MSKHTIYGLGIVPLGLTYFWLKSLLPGPVLVGSVIVCAIALRLIAERFGREPA